MDRVDEILYLYEDVEAPVNVLERLKATDPDKELRQKGLLPPLQQVEMAHGGRIGLDNGGLSFSRGGKKRNPLTSEMTPEQIRKQNAQKTFRKKGLGSASESNPKFVDFLETYKTRDQQTLERGEELKKANKLKNKARTIEAIKELPGDVVLKGSNRIKDGFLIRQNLLNSYHTFFEQAYDEAIEAGGLFNRADLGRAVIKKIEEAYPKSYR